MRASTPLGLVLAGLVLAAGACTPDTEPPEAPEALEFASVRTIADYESVDAHRSIVGESDATPDPGIASRHLRRMNVRQLKAAISQATGGLAWVDNRGNDMLDRLSPTLGVPDYIETTTEDLDATLVFQKFLGDGARQVCDDAINNDLSMEPADRVLLVHADPSIVWEDATPAEQDDIDKNLRHMKLRITGHYIAPDDVDSLKDLRWLFRSVTHATTDPNRGWRAVCVGLMTSPEFYLY